MNKKTLTVRQMATIKRVAQNVNPLIEKRNKVLSKIEQLKSEFLAINKVIEAHEMGVMALTDGLTSDNLVVKKVENTEKLDKNGNPIKVTKYEPRAVIVTFNKDTNLYEIDTDIMTEEQVTDENLDDTALTEVEVKPNEEMVVEFLGEKITD